MRKVEPFLTVGRNVNLHMYTNLSINRVELAVIKGKGRGKVSGKIQKLKS